MKDSLPAFIFMMFVATMTQCSTDDLYVWLFDQEAPYECTTDDECLKFCPPPADDPDCDGGPERRQRT